ncbi:hypothetical protein PP1Y_AT10804 [Novosphingobium sp. PP1Y]|nr:hypothetical protein PP1Y_AT10804 [Novosphingobium sp. PP1Y]
MDQLTIERRLIYLVERERQALERKSPRVTALFLGIDVRCYAQSEDHPISWWHPVPGYERFLTLATFLQGLSSV